MTIQSSFIPSLEPEQLAEVTRIIGEIDEFKGQWRTLGEIRPERLATLRQVTTIESAGSSTRIEGAQLSDSEVALLLKGLETDRFRERDEAEVLGYAELLQTIFDNYAEIPLSENHIKQLHKILLGHSERDAWHRGDYKKHDNHLEMRHPDGRIEIIFHTASPFDTPHRMSDLVTATSEVLDRDLVHPLIVIARFVVEFLAIHPFQDGNGRLSRALTAHLMLRVGYEYVQYASIERVIEDNKAEYYRALRITQAAMEEDQSCFADWLLFFLRVLRTQKRSLAAKLEVERSLIRLSKVQQRVLDLVESHGRVTTSEVAGTLGLPKRSVRYHLSMLVKRGLLQAHGERKGRYYTRLLGVSAGPVAVSRSGNAAILAEILQRGGSVTSAELTDLLDEHDLDRRMAGALHGRRAAYLRRDKKTGRSVLTARGRELAEQHLFAQRLARHSPM